MKIFEAQVLANKSLYVKGKNWSEAKQKARKLFMKKPGKLEIIKIQEVDS